MNTTLYLIRHAEVETRYQGVFGGVIDMNLSPRGEGQAAALAAYLRAHTFDAIFSSPMKRVQQTLTPVRPGRAQPVVVPRLHEVDFGAWTGLTFAEVKARFGREAHEWLHQLDAGNIPKAETTADLRARIQGCLDEMLAENRGRTVAVFCHGGVIRMLLSLLLHLPFAEMDRFEVEYASVTTVVLKPERARLVLSNFTPWRDLPR